MPSKLEGEEEEPEAKEEEEDEKKDMRMRICFVIVWKQTEQRIKNFSF